MPYAKNKDVNIEVDKMLKAGIVEPTKSGYNSPIVMVKKKDGSYRLCIDFGRLNNVTRFDPEPMGDIEAILSKLRGSNIFTINRPQ